MARNSESSSTEPVLVALSGGLDSVALLWFLLNKDNTPLHVHHVSIRSKSGRWKLEDRAVERILPLMRKVREFGYSESVYDVKTQGMFYDVTIVSRECAENCKRLGIHPSLYCRGGALHDEGRPGIKKRRQRALDAWRSAWDPKKAPPVSFPLSHMSRLEMHQMLPKDVFESIWSCRRPWLDQVDQVWKPCGKCHTCEEFAAEKLGHPS